MLRPERLEDDVSVTSRVGGSKSSGTKGTEAMAPTLGRRSRPGNGYSFAAPGAREFTGHVRTTVLVEGRSDEVAVRALARAYGRDLAAGGIDVVPMGGITNIRAAATRSHAAGERLAGLYDSAEVRFVRRARRGRRHAGEDADQGGTASSPRPRPRGGAPPRARHGGVERVIAAAGETRSLERLARMPAQRAGRARTCPPGS